MRDTKSILNLKENREKTKYSENDKKVCPILIEKKREKERESKKHLRGEC
jgi:hypothetical protein